MKHLLIGIDIGTTVIKSVAFGLDGTELAVSRLQNSGVHFYGNRAECDMELLWETTARSLYHLTHEILSGESYQIEAVSISGNMVGLWMLDEENHPVCPAALWNDGRSADLLTEWMESDAVPEIFNESGNVMNPGFTLPLMYWTARNEPEKLRKARHIFFCKDWIRFCLTGKLYTEETDASHFPGSLKTRNISDKLLNAFGLEKYKSCFPTCLTSTEIAGHVTREASRLTGLEEGIPVVAGLADVSASVLGAGSIESGERTLILGTSCLCTETSAHPILEPKQVGLTFLLPEGLYIRALPNQTGMMAIDWFYREVWGDGQDTDFTVRQSVENVIEKEIPPGCDGLIFHPYLNNTGLVAPQYAPKARGQFHGLSLSHSRYHLAKAVYEGAAFAVRDCFTALGDGKNKEIRFVGGGRKNRYLSQLICDILGNPILEMANEENGALGAAMAAGVGVGLYSDLTQAVKICCKSSRKLLPNMEQHEKYQPYFEKYQRLREIIVNECNHGKERT